MPRTPLPSKSILKSLVTLSATPSPTLKSWAEPNRRGFSNVLHTPVGEVLRHSFHHGVPRIQIDYPANVTGGDREEIVAEFFEQDRWGRTVAAGEERPEPSQTAVRRRTLGRQLYEPLRTIKRVSIQGPKGHHRPPRDRDPRPARPSSSRNSRPTNGGMKGVRLAYIHEGETGFMAIFYAPGEGLRRMEARRRLLHSEPSQSGIFQ